MAKKILSRLGVIMIALLGMRHSVGQTVSKPRTAYLLMEISSK